MPDDPSSRDTALARLMAEALDSQSQGAGDVAGSACPDAEVLAAYAERGLTEEETARCESHFADCRRCQKIIAVLAASDDELTEAEVERLGRLAAAPEASSAARRPVTANPAWWALIWHRPVLWRWLVPVAGLASVAGLWFALHQAPPRETLSAQKTIATMPAPQNGAAAASAKSDENQIAQANLPPLPESAPRSEVLLRDKEAAQAKTPGVARQEEAKKQEALSNPLQASQFAGSDRAADTREYDAKDNRLQSAQAAEQKAITDALSAPAPVVPAAPPPLAPPLREADRAERLDRAAGAPAAAQMKALAQAQVATPTAVFASPSRRTLWRLGPAGRIEHSADQGQTWQPQSSGVTADLLAGVAPSETVAWAVGRVEVILRTEDGEHWQRVQPPPLPQNATSTPARDWIGVEARDALHATITSRELRRFATEDGGRTWAQVQ